MVLSITVHFNESLIKTNSNVGVERNQHIYLMNSNVHGSLFSVFPLTHIFVMVNNSDNYGTDEACVNRNIFIAEYTGVYILT